MAPADILAGLLALPIVLGVAWTLWALLAPLPREDGDHDWSEGR